MREQEHRRNMEREVSTIKTRLVLIVLERTV